MIMPVMGPDSNRENAELAIKQITELLKTKFHIDIDKVEDWGICRVDVNKSNKSLKDAIYEVFKYDSWNGW
jgi:ribosomal protein S6